MCNYEKSKHTALDYSVTGKSHVQSRYSEHRLLFNQLQACVFTPGSYILDQRKKPPTLYSKWLLCPAPTQY